MLSVKLIGDIATFLKITPDALKTAIEAKEEKAIDGLDLAVLQSFTTPELTERDNNTRTQAKETYTTAGKEIAIKELKTAAGLSFEGKDAGEFVRQYKEKILTDAKLSPSQREAELQTQIGLLTTARDTALNEANSAKESLTRASLERSLIGAFPANREGGLSDDERLLLFNARYEPKDVDGKRVWVDRTSKEELRDKQTAKPLDDKSVVSGFFTEKGWLTKPADPKDGRGKGNEGGAAGGSGNKPTKYSEAKKDWIAQGKSINDSGFAVYVSGLKKENTAFEMDLAAE